MYAARRLQRDLKVTYCTYPCVSRHNDHSTVMTSLNHAYINPCPAQCMRVWTFLATSNSVVFIAVRPYRTDEFCVYRCLFYVLRVCVFFFFLTCRLKTQCSGRAALNIDDCKVINANESRDSNKCLYIFTRNAYWHGLQHSTLSSLMSLCKSIFTIVAPAGV